jgi:hypothetical protein
MKEVYLIVGIKESEGTLKLTRIEATPDETTIAEAVARAQSPDHDYIGAIHAWSTAGDEEPSAAPKQ